MRLHLSLPEPKPPFLIGSNMTGGYGGGADILHDCTISVLPGEIAVIVGPNGAGKSTAMKALFGMLDLREGQVMLDGTDIGKLSPQARVAQGMGFVPQTSNIFTSMTVEENLEMGAFIRTDDYRSTMEQVFELFPILAEKRRQPAGELSGGQRQQVAVGRALMTQPKVLMLDEPTAGVSPIVMDELFDRIIEVSRTGLPILMVEQNARQALQIADQGFVLVQGRNAFTGTGRELLEDPEVRKSFLGGIGPMKRLLIALSVCVLGSSAFASPSPDLTDEDWAFATCEQEGVCQQDGRCAVIPSFGQTHLWRTSEGVVSIGRHPSQTNILPVFTNTTNAEAASVSSRNLAVSGPDDRGSGWLRLSIYRVTNGALSRRYFRYICETSADAPDFPPLPPAPEPTPEGDEE